MLCHHCVFNDFCTFFGVCVYACFCLFLSSAVVVLLDMDHWSDHLMQINEMNESTVSVSLGPNCDNRGATVKC